MKTKRYPNRRGFAMVIAAMFCVIFVTILGVAWRQMASTIGTFSARSAHIQQDQGAMMALAEAMRALEVGPPPFEEESTTYTCYCTINNVPVMQDSRIKYPNSKDEYPESPKTCYYQLTFVQTGTTPSDRTYSVTVTSVSSLGTPAYDINNFGVNGPF